MTPLLQPVLTVRKSFELGIRWPQPPEAKQDTQYLRIPLVALRDSRQLRCGCLKRAF